MSAVADLFGASVLDRSGKVVDLAKHLAGKKVGIYFSAHWCPPCRGFTPVLVKYYNDRHEKENFEIIFVSADNDEASFKKYYDEMPWLTVDFNQTQVKENLGDLFGVSGIPSLIVLDGKTADVVTREGRSVVTSGSAF